MSSYAVWERAETWKPDARRFVLRQGSKVLAEVVPTDGCYKTTVTGDQVFKTAQAAMAAARQVTG